MTPPKLTAIKTSPIDIPGKISVKAAQRTNMSVNYTPDEIKKAHDVLYNEGLKMRYQVAGKEHVDRSIKAADNAFARPMQEARSPSHLTYHTALSPC